MAKGAEAFRSIGEAAVLIGVAPHVLRYWETQFAALKPMKRPDGRRYYRPADLDLAAGICALLRDDGLTIRGARKLIDQDRGESVRRRGAAHLAALAAAASAMPPLPDPAPHAEEMPPMSDNLPLPPADPAPAPLFPDLDRAHRHAVWLARLTQVTRHLQQITPADPRWPGVRPVALRLGQAMLQLA
ncbi:MerR family transcriptional regulator [Paracoccus liaowanqingii]|uniref:MerR family transcriptional regulator n=1 Tax=Paracoccus liaowanqingii TaxID=2560053 RepID=A0A4P7HQJ5_9RHOB|nr:MerR family transcriptional regulator [Paracoccus liaowanqingii]QBX35581.1 MerR family transcriptional regulator [Paracoccus liaowanqingii]